MSKTFWKWLGENTEQPTDEPAFLAAIRVNPKDRLPWLVFADWLDERSDPRGSLIRALIGAKGKRQASAFATIEEVWEQVMPTALGSLLQRANKVAETSALLSSRRRHTVGLAATAQILKLAKNYDDVTELEAAMGKINQLMGGYGVESIRGEAGRGGYWGGYWGDSVAIYVNVGESYDNTVLFNLVTYRVQITSMGDFVERYGQRYGIE